MFTGSAPRAHELAAAAALGEPEPLEAHQHRAREAVVDLGEVDVGRREPGRAPEVVGEQPGVVPREVVPEERVAHVEAGAAAGHVRGALQHCGRMGEVTGRVERGDDHRARAVDLDRAVGHPEGFGDVGRGEVGFDGVRHAQIGTFVLLPYRALGDRHRREVGFGLAGLDQEAPGPQRDVVHVGGEAHRVPEVGRRDRAPGWCPTRSPLRPLSAR